MRWINEMDCDRQENSKSKSLKYVLTLYILLAIFCVVIVYILTYLFLDSWKRLICIKYGVDTTNIGVLTELVNPSEQDINWLMFITFIQIFSIIIYSVIAMVITVHKFYDTRIKEPIKILIDEMECIRRNDLSFECNYVSDDDLGRACKSFDQMRLQLIKNQEIVWKQLDAQRQLNHIFAHDIRTPLTVIMGYNDMLLKYYEKGKISQEKLLETLQLTKEQLLRMKNFSESMKDIQSIEQVEVKKKLQPYDTLIKQVEKMSEALENTNGIQVSVINRICEKEGYYDGTVILEVLDNLLGNAVAFTQSKVDIILEWSEDYLYLSVRDDGEGFSTKELYSAIEPYYSSRGDNKIHFGLGLAICKLLCQKHGGNLTLHNSASKGAIVCASFFSNIVKE